MTSFVDVTMLCMVQAAGRMGCLIILTGFHNPTCTLIVGWVDLGGSNPASEPSDTLLYIDTELMVLNQSLTPSRYSIVCMQYRYRYLKFNKNVCTVYIPVTQVTLGK